MVEFICEQCAPMKIYYDIVLNPKWLDDEKTILKYNARETGVVVSHYKKTKIVCL